MTDALYQRLYKTTEKEVSLHITVLDENRFNYTFDQSVQAIQLALAVVASVRKLKSEKQISLKTELKALVIYGDSLALEMLTQQEMLLKGVTKSASIQFSTDQLEAEHMAQDVEVFVAHVTLPDAHLR